MEYLGLLTAHYYTRALIMKRPVLLILCWLLVLHLASAQSVITGHVRTDRGAAVEYARVLALAPTDSAILAYAFTDATGSYRLSVRSPHTQLILSAASMEIERTDKRVPNSSQTCDFVVKESRIILKEVQVKARKIWGQSDTINYSVGGFIGKNDVVIADVLRKLPGIEVTLEGLIKYQGKPINKFYIEGLDALQGRYGIATNNISAKDVATVQVLENHQPVKALEKSRPSDQAAINLKLKDEVKGTFSMTVQLGLGYDTQVRRSEELIGMYFAKRRQHILTGKSNDNGQDIQGELRSFTATSPLPSLTMTALQYPASPDIHRPRYYHNDTHAFTANNLYKLKNEAEFNANLIFYHDRERAHGASETSYFLPEGTQIIREDLRNRSTTNQLEGELRYNINKDRLYFNNLLELKASWEQETGAVSAGQDLEQEMRQRYLSATNVSHWVRTGEGGRGLEIYWRNAVATTPHRLRVHPGLYIPQLNTGVPYAEVAQDVRHRAFVSLAQLSLLSAWRLGGISVNPTLFLRAQHQALDTELGVTSQLGTYHPLSSREMHNGISFTRLGAGLGHELTYKSETFNLYAVLPLFYYHTLMQDEFRPQDRLSEGRLYFEPNGWLSYHVTPDFSIKLYGSMSRTEPTLSSLYAGYIMRSYRSLVRNEMRQFSSLTTSTGLNLEYKDIFSMLFVGCGLSYSHYHSDAISSTKIEAPHSVVERLPLPHSGQSYSANARFSKGFDWLSLSVSGDAALGQSEGKSYIQDKLLGYTSQSASASARCSLKPIDWLSMEYNVSWGLHRSRREGAAWFTPIQNLSHKLISHVNVLKDVAIKLTAEHYYNDAVTQGRHFTLADVGLAYTWRRVRFSLDWTNILDARLYSSGTITDLVASHSYYDIRPSAIMLKARFKLF